MNPIPEAIPIVFDTYEAPNGILGVYESGKCVPFDVKRVFTIRANSGQDRGDHSHRRCTQLLICLSGSIQVYCDNGHAVQQHLLDNMAIGLLIPPGIWTKQRYLDDNAILMVLCDRHFESEDYVRDYAVFRSTFGLEETK